jgi:hypothetical protein
MFLAKYYYDNKIVENKMGEAYRRNGKIFSLSQCKKFKHYARNKSKDALTEPLVSISTSIYQNTKHFSGRRTNLRGENTLASFSPSPG